MNLKPLLMAVIALMLMSSAGATSSFVTGLCGGNSTAGSGSGNVLSGGVIPTNNVLTGQTAGEQSVLNISLLIMLVMLLIVALLYMFSYVLNLSLLMNIAKSEIGEIFVTAIIVFIFLGTFNVAGAALGSNNIVYIAGSSFGRNLYVSDCSYLGTASIDLIPYWLSLNVIRQLVGAATSFKLTIEPAFFGFSVSPLQGYDLIDTILEIVVDMIGGFVVFILSVMAVIGFIYALFPLFLYAGIILRTLPWTRAAGGAFLGLFVGFYIVFPIILHIMLSGYIGGLSSTTVTANSNSISTLLSNSSVSGSSSGSSTLSSITTFLKSAYNLGAAVANLGLVNFYLQYAIEPAALTIVSIVISFIISFDFAETAGDLLGAPSLTAGSILGKYV